MSNPEQHFSETVLRATEVASYYAMRYKWGQAAVRHFSGSQSPAYEQALYLPWYHIHRINNPQAALVIDGDPSAGGLPKDWLRAVVLSVDRGEYTDLKAALPKRSGEYATFPKDAYLYFTGEHNQHAHAAIPNGFEAELFASIDDDRMGLAVRLGHGPLKAQLGLMNHRNEFTLFRSTRVTDYAVSVMELPIDHPGVRLI